MTDSAPYIGARIRLISKNDIRYEGTLHSIDSGRSTVILSEVRSFGTEDRKPAGQQIQASNEIFDFIEFPSHDIKQLTVCQLPPSVPQQTSAPTGQQQQGQPWSGPGSNPQQSPFGTMPGQFAMGMPYGPQGWHPYFNMYGPNPWSNQQGFGMNPMPPMGMNPFQQGPGFGFPPGPMPGAPLVNPTPAATPTPNAVNPAAPQTNATPATTKPENAPKPQETKTSGPSTTPAASTTTTTTVAAPSEKKTTAPSTTTAAPTKTATATQPRATQPPQSSAAKGQPTVQRPRNPWENKQHPTVVAPPSGSTTNQGPAQQQSGQSRDRQQGQSRAQNGTHTSGQGRQGQRGGHRGGRGGRQQYAVKAPTFSGDYDFEKSNEKFEHLLEELEIKPETSQILPQEPAYDKTRSFFDTISCEASEKKDDENLDRRAKNKLLQDQKRLDTETFGGYQVDQVYREHMQQSQQYHRGHQNYRGHRPNYRGGDKHGPRTYNQPQQRSYSSNRGGRGGQSGQYKTRGQSTGSTFKPVQASNAAKQ